jgi:pyruvate dehydrogenase E2 component (dihydrolipoamide acetyltransferase)
MPQLGETVTEGTIIRWLKKVGDPVAQDEPLFEVSTDKVDSEVPSSASGYLAEILVPEGATVDVGARLAVVTAEPPAAGGAAPAAPAPPAAPPPPAAPAAPAPPAVPPPPAAPAAPAPPAAAPPPAAPAAPPTAAASPGATAAPPPAPPVSEPTGRSATALLLSPVVRRLIAENGIDPSEIRGTGQGGRITRADVLAYLDARAAAGGSPAAPAAAPTAAPAAAPPPVAPAAPAAPATSGAGRAGSSRAEPFPPVAPGQRDEVIPFTNIRRLTAEHMVRSKATSAHTLAAIEVDYEKVEEVRRAVKERFREEEGISLTYLPFVARAVVDVLRDYPNLNASVGEDALVVHRDIHLGIAVDLDRQGLIVPVVRNADGQSLRGLARAIADLANRARSRRLSADDIVGGTFTITNPGPFGTFLTAPIINQPQVGILSTDGVKRRPVVVPVEGGGEAIAIHSVGLLGLSFDHRAVDGAYASAFLRDLAEVVATRDWAAEL